jgi:hypothetical protein
LESVSLTIRHRITWQLSDIVAYQYLVAVINTFQKNSQKIKGLKRFFLDKYRSLDTAEQQGKLIIQHTKVKRADI